MVTNQAPAPAPSRVRGGALGKVFAAIRTGLAQVPLMGWLLGILAAVILEYSVGLPLARELGLGRVPLLFGVDLLFRSPSLVPSALAYMLIVYILPVAVVARLIAPVADWLAARLFAVAPMVSVVAHAALFYLCLHLWATMNDYRVLIVKLILIAVMLTLSLNLVNGYMGEFSCSHPGFMALGAYASSVITVVFLVDDRTFGATLLPSVLGPFLFPVALIIGGLAASLGALIVAIPSFRTRGDYLAIISLAFMFVVKSFIENLEVVGGPRGFMGQPNWASLPTVFIWAVLCVAIINNFVRSTVGKALNAVRDGEAAAEAMTVNTRRTKMVTFLFAAFWAGVAGGLFAHVMRYVNPGTFGLQKLAELLAMLYFGGLNSIVGSVAGAVGFSLFSEALRPLEIYKWLIIPFLLILVMIFRPRGLISFKEFDMISLVRPRRKKEREGPYVAASD